MSWFLFISICFLCSTHHSAAVVVPHGTLEGISIPGGISSVLFVDLPPSSSFALIQLHSPFNPILASVVPSFDYDASQNSEHCGLISVLGNDASNVTLYLYSGYEDAVPGWVRADAYSSEFPIPGGCGRHLLSDSASAALSTDTMKTPSWFDTNTSRVNLRYWTSLLKFEAASVPGQLSGIYCSNVTFTDRLTYRLYSTPLVTAGGSHGSFINPTPYQVAEVLKHFSSTTDDFDTQPHIFKSRPSLLTKWNVELPISRRPGTAILLKLVVEYDSDTVSTRVAYAPVVLYGCRENTPEKSGYGAGFLVRHHSTRLACGVLPTDAPNIYFLVAVLLLASLFYGFSCHLLVWPRCAASVMVVASVIGTVLFFRYSYPSSYATLLLAMSILLPGVLALIIFLIIWCLCIRPTLHYQQVYGRGPLLRLARSERIDSSATVYEPWDSDLLLNNTQDRQNVNLLRLPREVRSNPLSMPCSVIEGQPIYGTFAVHSPSRAESDEQNSPTHTSWFATVWNRLRCSHGYSEASSRLFTLKPRRIARLPPVLPAAFLLVTCFSVLLDQSLSLNTSSASYLSFVILTNILLAGVLCIFKNLAFGISTAFVGTYLSLGCFCLFLIPNALLPHILIEQFLRLTWIEQRLETVRIDFFGLYDVLLMVAWIIGTLVFGLLTLCLVRLKDARELAEAQHSRPMSQPFDQASRIPPPISDVEVVALSHDSLILPSRFTSSTKTAVIEGGVDWNLPNVTDPLSRAGYDGIENCGFSDLEDVPSTSHLPSERSLLLPSLPRNPSSSLFASGLASRRQSPLVPLSRVQLACGKSGATMQSLSSSHLRSATDVSHPTLYGTSSEN